MDADQRRRRLAQFDRQLAHVAPPLLEPLGFRQQEARVFRRSLTADHGTLVHFVRFQVGIKGLAGQFTCSLHVYHSAFCRAPGAVAPADASWNDGLAAMWVRVARLAPVAPSLFDRLRGRVPEPQDRWWPMSDDAAVMARALVEPLTLVTAHAPAWFETYGTEAACRAEAERVAARRPRTS